MAEEEFRKELLTTVEYDEEARCDHQVNKDRYWNKFRKIAYQFAIKGQAVTLYYLGYLMLKYQCGTPEGIEVIENISPFDVDGVVNTLAEGVGVALYIHSDIKRKFTPQPINQILFKPDYDAATYLDLLKQSPFVILNSAGEYIYGSKKKSFVTAFFDVLGENGIINHHNASNLAPLLNALIPKLSITSRTLQNTTTKSNEMKAYFQALINTL